MIKSGLIVGGIMLVLSLGGTLFSPICVPCIAFIIGLGAGYLSGVFDKPAAEPAASKAGVLAGTIGGIGTLLGESIGAAINAIAVGPEKSYQIMQNLGIGTAPATSPTFYWIGFVGMNLCTVVFSVALMAGLGAVGGTIWWRTTGIKQAPLPPMFPRT